MRNNKILLILFLVVSYTHILAQQCWDNINTITTKWDEPNTSNTENWDWTLPGLVHPVYLKDNLTSPSILVELPYFCTKPVGSGGCNNKNTFSYEILSLTDKQDIYPENGWELVLKDFGSSNGAIAGRATKNPVFILYNKYTGKMKVYVAVIGNKQANSAYLQIYFSKDGIKRGVFAHANAIAKTAKVFDTDAKFKSLNDYALQNFEDSYQWLVSEIQMAYDPCTCQRGSGSSAIEVLPVLIDRSDIDANIEGTFVQSMMSAANGINGESNGKTSFNEMAVGAGKSAIKGYNDFTSYQKQLNAILDKSNGKYKDKLVKEWFDDYVKNNPQYQGVNNLPDKYDLWDAFARTDDAYKRSLGIDKIDSYQKSSDFQLMKSIASYIPYVGSAIGLIDFFVNGGKEAEPPKPSPPMVFNVNLKLKGTIVNPYELNPVSFLTPGSNNFGNRGNLTPIYNNTLGVFNVLRPPSVNAVAIKPQIIFPVFFQDNQGQSMSGLQVALSNGDFKKSSRDAYLATDIFKQYKLNEDIKYMVNPASNMTVELIDACIVLEYTEAAANLIISNRRFNNGIQNNPSLPFYPDMFKPGTTLSDRIAQIENTGLDLEYINSKDNVIRFRTKYVPLSCLKNQSFLLFAGQPPTVFVKLLVKMRRTDNVSSELITQIVTYDISSSFVSPTIIPTDCQIALERVDIHDNIFRMEGINTVIADFITFGLHEGQTLSMPNCLPFAGINQQRDMTYYAGMTNMAVNGTIFIPINTTVTSNTWLKAKNIIMGTSVIIQDGVQLISEKNIEVTPESIINPSAILKTEVYSNIDLWNCPTIDIADLEATDEEIEAQLCSNSSYQARVMAKKGDDGFMIPNKVDKPEFNFDIYPNPAKNSIALTLNSDETISFSITILDIVGKVVASGIELQDAKDKSLINIDLSGLNNGVYFCSMLNNRGQQVIKKFIIAK